MRRTMDKLLRRWGMPLLLRGQEEIGIRGFLQQSGSQSWNNTYVRHTPVGKIPGGHYLYIGPLVPTREGDTLLGEGKEYILRRVETVRLGNEPVYVWGLCVEKGGEDTWGADI